MPKPQVFDVQGYMLTDLPILARVHQDGDLITQAGITSIAYAVYDRSATLVGDGSLDVGDCVFDTLQTDLRWTVDRTGYNFLGVIPGELFETGGNYTVTVVFTPADGSTFPIVASARIVGYPVSA